MILQLVYSVLNVKFLMAPLTNKPKVQQKF